jgi:hypothetical protein
MTGLLLFIPYFLIIFAPENMLNIKLRSMKRLLFICGLAVVSLTASAQFTVYQPVEVPSTSYTPRSGYGTPFTIYEPVYSNPYQQRQQQAIPTMPTTIDSRCRNLFSTTTILQLWKLAKNHWHMTEN